MHDSKPGNPNPLAPDSKKTDIFSLEFLFASLTTGASNGIFRGIVGAGLNPFAVAGRTFQVKAKQQDGTPLSYYDAYGVKNKNPLNLAVEVVKQRGYAGAPAVVIRNFIREVPRGFVFLGPPLMVENLLGKQYSNEHPVYQKMFTATCLTAYSTLFNSPFDFVRVLQMNRAANKAPKLSMLEATKFIYQQGGGVGGYYAGWQHSTMFFAAFWTALMGGQYVWGETAKQLGMDPKNNFGHGLAVSMMSGATTALAVAPFEPVRWAAISRVAEKFRLRSEGQIVEPVKLNLFAEIATEYKIGGLPRLCRGMMAGSMIYAGAPLAFDLGQKFLRIVQESREGGERAR